MSDLPRHSTPTTDIGGVVQLIDKQRAKYEGILPSNVRFDDFRNTFLIAVQTNPRLLGADRQSLWLSLQKAASDGLKPDGREGALVIFGDEGEDENGNPVASQAKGQKKVVWMPMVWGLCKTMRNTGRVASIRAKLIFRGEHVEIIDEDGRETYRHRREIGGSCDETEQNIVGAYAVVQYTDGTWEAEFMSRAQIERARSVSRAKAAAAPWQKWYGQMAMKTALRRLALRVERSAENLRYLDAITTDTTTIDGEADANDVTGPAALTHEQRQGQTIEEMFAGTMREPVVTSTPRTEPVQQQEARDQTKQSQPAGTIDDDVQTAEIVIDKTRKDTAGTAPTFPETSHERQNSEQTDTSTGFSLGDLDRHYYDDLGLTGRALGAAKRAYLDHGIKTIEAARTFDFTQVKACGAPTAKEITDAIAAATGGSAPEVSTTTTDAGPVEQKPAAQALPRDNSPPPPVEPEADAGDFGEME